MKNQPPLKQIVQETRPIWDRDDTPEHVRKNLRKVLACKTSELGAEVYQSESEKKVVYHTCKSRSCPSCGHTTTRQWQRERWAALPDIPFATMVFTMPHFLWPIFRHNRHLLHDLPTLAAAVLQTWARSSRGTRLFITVIPHTFGARLNFHPHLHILVSAGGLQEADGSWVDRVPFNKQEIMCLWRHAVTLYLLKAVKSGIVSSSRSTPEMNDLLVTQYRRWWNIHIDRRASKTHFLRYVGRYVRRPPIAQRNLISVSDGKVQFRVKDRKTQ